MPQTRLGINKAAAYKIGISQQEYQDNLNAGLKWCCSCKEFVERELFHNNKSKSDGKSTICKVCMPSVNSRYRFKKWQS